MLLFFFCVDLYMSLGIAVLKFLNNRIRKVFFLLFDRSLVTKYGTSLFFIRLLFPTQSIPKLLSIEATSRTIKELLEEVGNLYINIKLKSGFNISAWKWPRRPSTK